MGTLVRRIHDRDNHRDYEAMERAQQLQKQNGELLMATPQSGLAGPHELLDLLEYLADNTFCFRCRANSRGPTARPGLLSSLRLNAGPVVSKVTGNTSPIMYSQPWRAD